MNRREFENRKKGNLGNMRLEDWTEAMKRKEDIWSSLDINADKKKPSLKWLLWFLLGFLLALSGSLLINHFAKEDIQESAIIAANELVEENDDLRNTVKEERQKAILNIQYKDEMIDSLTAQNQHLNDRLMAFLNSANANASYGIEKIILTDTVYLTETVMQEVIKERIIRDTVWLNKPLDDPELNLMADNTDVNGTSKSDAEIASQEKKRKTKRKSIQFNFSEIQSERD